MRQRIKTALKRLKTALKRNGAVCFASFIIAIIVIFAIAALVGCSTPRVITETKVERVHDTIVKEKTRVDSVYVSRYQSTRNDTIIIRDSVIAYRHVDVGKAEKVYIYKTDSIPYEVERVVEVARPRSGYDKFCSTAWWVMVSIALLRVAWWAFRKFYLNK